MSCPYGRRLHRRPIMKDKNSMHMVRHNDEGAQFNVPEMLRDQPPAGVGDAATGRKTHLVRNNLAEQWQAGLGDHGDEIRARLTVIVCGPTDRPTIPDGPGCVTLLRATQQSLVCAFSVQ